MWDFTREKDTSLYKALELLNSLNFIPKIRKTEDSRLDGDHKRFLSQSSHLATYPKPLGERKTHLIQKTEDSRLDGDHKRFLSQSKQSHLENVKGIFGKLKILDSMEITKDSYRNQTKPLGERKTHQIRKTEDSRLYKDHKGFLSHLKQSHLENVKRICKWNVSF
ncbi:hypothetical protein CDAR_242841 [Caerostris darwini]|uniref:Uncharacterized protein n=1 Tax=Caerostris darwini TaxID=1538125 RepID=A0AAV4W269_9ARAC|nr:hypothetical protein CDAR_242841 [Caerostris darwini]